MYLALWLQSPMKIKIENHKQCFLGPFMLLLQVDSTAFGNKGVLGIPPPPTPYPHFGLCRPSHLFSKTCCVLLISGQRQTLRHRTQKHTHIHKPSRKSWLWKQPTIPSISSCCTLCCMCVCLCGYLLRRWQWRRWRRWGHNKWRRTWTSISVITRRAEQRQWQTSA